MKLEVPVQTWSSRATRCRSAGFTAATALSVISCGHFDFAAGSLDEPAEPGDDSMAACASGPSQPVLVQFNHGFSLTSAADKVPLTVRLDLPAHPGNLLILTGADTSGELAMPSAKGTGPWTRPAGTDTYNNSEIWYATINTSEFDGKVTIRAADSSGSDSSAMPALRMILMEWHGLSGDQDPTDGKVARSGLSQAPGPGAITTKNSVDLVLLDVAVDTSDFATSPDGPSDWLLVDTIIAGTNATERAWYRFTSTPGTFDPTVSITAAGSHQWDASLVAFKVAPPCPVAGRAGSGDLQ